MLEFGQGYMRVAFDGAQVTETPFGIVSASQTNPATITVGANGATAATPNNAGVSSSYSTGELITLAGGTFPSGSATVLSVSSTEALRFSPIAPGSGYAPTDTVTMAGGAHSVAAVASITTTLVASVGIGVAGSGGADGPQVATGTTGTGRKFQVGVTVAGGVITAIGSIIDPGSYTVNPTIAGEPVTVTGGGLAAARLTLGMGVETAAVATPGDYTVNPVSSTFTQASSSGAGTGATFFVLMGIGAAAVASPGVYSVPPANPVAQASTTGSGVGATFTMIYSTGTPSFDTGDWIYVAGVFGMTELNGNTYVVTRRTAFVYALADIYGNDIDATGFAPYVSGGTAARIYTLATPWNDFDLAYLKYSQSKNIMNLTLVNQQTGAEYSPYKLTRIADDNWTLVVFDPSSGISAPVALSGIASNTGVVNYAYTVTAIDATTGSESVASNTLVVPDAVDMDVTAGSVVITWSAISNTQYYNVYKASPGYMAVIPAGALYGFAGSSYGTRLIDRRIVPDFSQVPPLHKNPFNRGQILKVDISSSTSDWTAANLTIISVDGTGAVFEVIIDVDPTTGAAGPIAAARVLSPGKNYKPGDMAVFTGDGTAATGVVTVGALTGTYPGTSAYFQQRFALAYTTNNPDTYFMSQVDSPDNFDSRIPTIQTDAIIGSPWSTQVNGLQWMIPVAGGLLCMTGLGAWMLAGVGSFATNVQPIGPSTQDAIPQAFTGVSATVVPQKINYDVLYVESKGSLYYDQPYQLYALSEPLDLTENSTHLFRDYTIRDNAWCEQPNKLLWATRSDGTLLSLTWLKAQQVQGWARHDTNGFFWSSCSVTEPPVDALYLVVERFPPAGRAYMIERMDNRAWGVAEGCWCVDSGLSLPQPQPASGLTASSANGLGAVSGYADLFGGSGWSAATVIQIFDDNNGPGAGAAYTPVIDGTGAITSLTQVSAGSGYQFPRFAAIDPENLGSGFSATAVLNNSTTFHADGTVFSPGSIGSVVRAGGGIAVVTQFVSATEVVANMLSPIVQILESTGLPVPFLSGQWTLTTSVSRIGGLKHLAGMTVTGLADGNVITPRVVDVDGFVALDTPASAIVAGLGFKAQLQSIYLDAGEPTVQGQRKKVAEVTLRLEDSRDVRVGANQPDGSTLSPPQLSPAWGLGNTLERVPNKGIKPYNALCEPLYTGDARAPVPGGYNTNGQVAVQQEFPLPLQVLADVPEVLQGDVPEVKASPRRGSRDSG